MTHTSLVEIERKYDVDGSVLVPDLVGVGPITAVTGPETADLAAIYYDTGEYHLARAKVALRRRTGGADAGWHLKLPADEGRTELQWPLDGATATVPDAVAQQVEEITAGHELIAIASIRNSRKTTLLFDAAGIAIAEVCDDAVAASDLVANVDRAWREWEVELKPCEGTSEKDRTSLLETIEVAILAAGAHPSSSSSKLARALGRV